MEAGSVGCKAFIGGKLMTTQITAPVSDEVAAAIALNLTRDEVVRQAVEQYNTWQILATSA